MRLFAVTALAMLAFAGNSILNRLALADGLIRPESFALIRLLSGALVLALLTLALNRGSRQARPGAWLRQGSLVGALSLAVYALSFSFGYIGMDAGFGALLLFGGVQVTLFGAALFRQHEVIGRLRWLGTGLALLGLLVLLLPGSSAPAPLYAGLMITAAVAWGFYTLAGRVAQDPLAATAANFVFASPVALLVWVLVWLLDGSGSGLGQGLGLGQGSGSGSSLSPGLGGDPSSLASLASQQLTAGGLGLALLSGVVTSGLGYALWYSALPQLRTTTAALSQLTVPILAAAGGILFLGESLTLMLGLATLLIIAGIGLSLRR